MEQKLQEDREKLKKYKERFQLERDLRADTEKEIVALKEALKKKKRKGEKDRKDLMNVISSLQAKVNVSCPVFVSHSDKLLFEK